jgi:large subunit ribosomal protein L29
MKRFETADLTSDELQAKVKGLKDELFHLRFKHATSQLEDHAKIKTTRRNIARCLTALTKRQAVEAAADA